MAVKKSLEEMVEIMLRNGMSKNSLKRALQNIGFSKDRVDKALAKTGLIGPQTERDEMPEELRTQKAGLLNSKNLGENPMVNQDNSLLRRIENLENSLKVFETMADKMEEIEKKVDSLFDIIGEYVPQILEKKE
ncbi:MAG: hypothetical protein ACFE7E_05645 [Candidatus Hodarchaeota archaeon]